MIKGFIEITDKEGINHLINIRYIEEIWDAGNGDGCWIYLAHNCPNATDQDYYQTREPYEVIKKLLMEKEGGQG